MARKTLRCRPRLVGTLAANPTPTIKGLPTLDQYLCLPGKEFFVMGMGAALQVEPVARNLAGGRKASDRIVEVLIKPSLAIINST